MNKETAKLTRSKEAMTEPDVNLYQCNPETLRDTQTTCLPMEMLIRIRNTWNDRFPSHAIPTGLRRKEELWAAIRARLKEQYKCESEYCAVQELGNAELKSSTASFFRPPKPANWRKNPTEWHDTQSIANVMEQYERAYPTFEFIGPVPIDFDTILGDVGRCVVDELCQLDLAKLRSRGKQMLGVIFNLDPHDKPGSHWVCAFVNIRDGEAYYYDSYGMKPCAEIRKFLQRCKAQGCRTILWNDIRHQRKSTECGTYCMYVIISLLKGRSFLDICQNPVRDEVMNSLRDLLYADEKPRALAVKEGAALLRL